MGWKLSLIGYLVCCFPISADSRGLCVKDTSIPSMPIAMCTMPTCFSATDCLPPTMDKTSALIEFPEPQIQWKDTDCPTLGTKGCWQVNFGFIFKIAASDPSGVEAIGVNLKKEFINHAITQEKYLAPVNATDTSGRYGVSVNFIDYVPAGGRVDLSVYEICSRDRIGNEGCQYPLGAVALNKSINTKTR